ncbi:MAG: hypothetical protein K6C14_01435 [Eubacterium sp.]|nr:hypothetical protein [Eubacterium sp.]
MSDLRTQKKNLYVDLVAILAFAALFGWFFYNVKFGVNLIDENYYITVAKRFADGERPLLDEWHLSQLSYLFLVIPYRLYVALSGSHEGAVLFFRYLFLASEAAVFWIIYISLRKYKGYALAVSVLFCSHIPFAIFSLNYHTMPQQMFVIIALLFFFEKESKAAYIFSGVLLSVAVLVEPPLTLAFIVYFAVCMLSIPLKNTRFFKTYGFIFSFKSIFWVSVGVAACAAVFLVFLQIKSGIVNVLMNIPNLVSDTAYKPSSFGGVFLKMKIDDFVLLYGKKCLAAFLVLVPLNIGAGRLSFGKRAKTLLLVLNFAAFIWTASNGLYNRNSFEGVAEQGRAGLFWFCFVTQSIPAFLLGINLFLLCKNKNPRHLTVILLGAAVSFANDCFSDVSLGICCSVSYVGTALVLRELVNEIRPERKTKRYAAFALVMCAVVCACTVWNGMCVYKVSTSYFTERKCAYALNEWDLLESSEPKLDSKIERGSYKGIYTISEINENYNGIQNEMQYIKDLGCNNLYIAAICPNLYFDFDMRYSAYTGWYRDLDVLTRQREFWRINPDRIPDYIYVPVIDSFGYVGVVRGDENCEKYYKGRMELIDELFDYELTELEYGSLLKVTGYKG